MEETWDNFKKFFPSRKERSKDYFVIEREYLDSHPESGYFTEIKKLEEFPDYIDYLPKGAIGTKVMEKMDGIKWLFFDIGSTLADESLVYEDIYRKIAKSANKTYDFVYDKALEYYKQNKRGDKEVSKLLGVEKPIWEPQYERLYDDAKECLERLSRKYKIGIIANQIPGTEQRLEKFGIRKYIDVIVASAEEGVAKPDRRMFEIALERANCSADQAVMVGDRIDYDIVPAKNIGMKTIWVKQGMGQYWIFSDESERPDYEATTLSELLGVL